MNADLQQALRYVRMAGMACFRPIETSYRYVPDRLFPTVIVPIASVDVFDRNPGVEPINEFRALRILEAIQAEIPMPPIHVYRLSTPPHQFELYHGFHRFHLSAALGFTHIPVAVNPWRSDSEAPKPDPVG